MILYGASGHAKVIIDILSKSGQKIDFLVDRDPDTSELLGHKVWEEGTEPIVEGARSIICIGANKLRKKLTQKLDLNYGRAIHPSATLSEHVHIAEGTVVMAGAVINSSTSIGEHVIVNTSAVVDHDCEIADFAHISPNATLCGNVSVGTGTMVGAGATIIPTIKVGNWATIGAGAVIINDVPDYAVVVGNPGRIVKYNNDQI